MPGGLGFARMGEISARNTVLLDFRVIDIGSGFFTSTQSYTVAL